MDLLLDTATGDLALGDDGRLSLTTSVVQLVAQRLSIKLDSQRGEWFLEETWGVRYLDTDGDQATILVKNPNIIAIVAELKTIILDTEGVIRLTAFGQQYSISGRTLRVDFTVQTDDGEAEVVVLIGDTPDALFDPEGSAFAVFNIIVKESSPCRD